MDNGYNYPFRLFSDCFEVSKKCFFQFYKIFEDELLMIPSLIIISIIMAFLGAPIFVVLSSLSLAAYLSTGLPLPNMIVDIYNKFSHHPFLYTLPLFTLLGYILAESKSSSRILKLVKNIFGWLPGGLALVGLVTCAFFTAFTGASGVTIIALGGLIYPALLKEKYPENFSLGLITSSGSLGLLLPPSLPVLIYCVVSETSVEEVFVAGLIPSLVLILLLFFYTLFITKKIDLPKEPFSFKNLLISVFEAKWDLFIPFFLIIGIGGGYVTIGESAALLIIYSLLVEIFIHQDLALKEIPQLVKKSMVLIGGIFIIMGSAYALTNYMIDAEIPNSILNFMKQFITSKILFLILLNIFLLFLGCLLDVFSAILVAVPLILPLASNFGLSPVHLGVIFLINLEIGYLTPPVGINLFLSSYRFDKPVLSIYKATVPFMFILLIGLLLVTYLESLSLFLVSYFRG